MPQTSRAARLYERIPGQACRVSHDPVEKGSLANRRGIDKVKRFARSSTESSLSREERTLLPVPLVYSFIPVRLASCYRPLFPGTAGARLDWHLQYGGNLAIALGVPLRHTHFRFARLRRMSKTSFQKHSKLIIPSDPQ